MLSQCRHIRFVPVVVVLLVGLAGTLLAWVATGRAVRTDLQQQFNTSTVRVVLRVQASLDAPMAELRGLVGLHHASDEMNEREWRRFARGIMDDERRTVMSCLRIREVEGGAAVVNCEPIKRIPGELSLQALAPTLKMASLSGRTQLSPAIPGLVGRSEITPVALVAALPREEGAGREWVAVVLNPRVVIGRAVEPLVGDLNIEVYDGRGETPEELLYSSIGGEAVGAGLEERVIAHMAGRELWLRLTPTARFLEQHRSAAPHTVLFTGLIVTSVAVLMVMSLSRSREAALSLSRVNAERRREAQQAREAVESAAAAKDRFLAMISHELRTPLTAILGHTELMLRDTLSTQEREESVRTLDRNAHHLLGMLNELLDLSKLAQGGMRIETVECSPVHVIEEAARLLRINARNKGVELTTEYAFPFPARVRTDAGRLHQILVNIVGNAVKFTSAGAVRIRANAQERGGAWELRVEVEDQGIGIPAEHMGRIFEPFYQGDASMSRRFGGTGLGLPISRQLARLMGGDVLVDSTPGVGSTFTLVVPVGAADGGMISGVDEATEPSDVAPAARTPALAGTILLVDDSPDNRRLITHWLTRAGARVIEAHDGREAVETVLGSLEAGRPPDLVLMDMQMPVLDGCEAAAAIRRGGYAGPVLALTANAAEGDRDRGFRAGCDDYLLKPVARDTLVRACASWLARGRLAAAAWENVGRAKVSGASIQREQGGGAALRRAG